MGATSDGLRLAATTLTVAPVPPPATITRRTAGTAMLTAPVVGLALAAVAGVAVYGARRAVGVDPGEVDTLLPAVIGVALLAIMTRGLHLDGLADTVDGLASYKPAEEARAVMRSGPVGPLGVAALLFSVLLQVACLSQAISAHHGTAALLVSCLAARLTIPLACRRGVAAAEPSGLGAMVAETVSRRVAVTTLVLGVGVAAAVATVDFHTLDRKFETAQAVTAVLVAVGGTELLRRHCSRRLGGLTGDVLGALVEVGMTLSLLVMSVTPPHFVVGTLTGV